MIIYQFIQGYGISILQHIFSFSPKYLDIPKYLDSKYIGFQLYLVHTELNRTFFSLIFSNILIKMHVIECL